MISPTLAAQAGDGRHKLAAAASPNSLLVSLVSVPGQASSQADDTLSLCLHAHAALHWHAHAHPLRANVRHLRHPDQISD